MTLDGHASANQKILILFKGHPGVGKSTVAQALAFRLQCPLTDKDDARDCLATLSDRVDGVRRMSSLLTVAMWTSLYLTLEFGHPYEWNTDANSEIAGGLQATLNSSSYAIMWRYTERQMAIGTQIIVDCPLARRELFDQGRAIAAKVLLPHYYTRSYSSQRHFRTHMCCVLHT